MLQRIKKLRFIINGGGVISFTDAALKGSARNGGGNAAEGGSARDSCFRGDAGKVIGSIEGETICSIESGIGEWDIGEGIDGELLRLAHPPLFTEEIEAGDELMAILTGGARMAVEIEESVVEGVTILITVHKCGIEPPEKLIGWHRIGSRVLWHPGGGWRTWSSRCVWRAPLWSSPRAGRGRSGMFLFCAWW